MIATTSPLFAPMVIGTALLAIVPLIQFGLAASGWVIATNCWSLRHKRITTDVTAKQTKRGQPRREAKHRASSALNTALLFTALLAVAWLIPWDLIARGNL